MSDDVHEIWSDAELDRALTALKSTVDTDEQRLRAARAELAGAAPEPRRTRHWGRWAVAAAAVLALIAGFLVVQTVSFGHRPPAASAAAEALNSAADKVGASDPPLGPTQFRYVATHAWNLGSFIMVGKGGNTSSLNLSLLQENLSETWVPADPARDCLIRRGATGNYRWVHGSDAEAKAAGIDLPKPDSADSREKCAQGPGNWQEPTPAWVAALPRDPHRLYDKLRADTAGRGQDPDLEMLVYVADALRGGQIPADLRAALYLALALVPVLEITDRAANLDGRVGVAYGIDRAGTRQEMIVDPNTGQFIGERETTTKDRDDLKAGTVTSYTSVTTAVAGTEGVRPPS
jgi:hypothetical protein